MNNPMDEVDQFLMGGGGGAPSAFTKYDGPGTRRGGKIVKRQKTQQTKYGTGELLWFDKEQTKPREQIEVTVETDLRDPERDEDNGHRRIFIKGSYLTEQVREAVKGAGAPGLQIGGQLYVTRLRQVTRTGNNGSYDDWDVRVEYIPAEDGFLMGGDASLASGNGNQPAQPTAPPAAAPAPPVANGNGAGHVFDATQVGYLNDAQLAFVQSQGMTTEAVKAMFPPPPGWATPADAGVGQFEPRLNRATVKAKVPSITDAQLSAFEAANLDTATVLNMFGASV